MLCLALGILDGLDYIFGVAIGEPLYVEVEENGSFEVSPDLGLFFDDIVVVVEVEPDVVVDADVFLEIGLLGGVEDTAVEAADQARDIQVLFPLGVFFDDLGVCVYDQDEDQ